MDAIGSRMDWFRALLGLVAVAGGLLALGGLYFIEVPTGNKDPVMLAIGSILVWGGTVISHSFGSSKGSEQKTELIRTQASGRIDDPVHVDTDTVAVDKEREQ